MQEPIASASRSAEAGPVPRAAELAVETGIAAMRDLLLRVRPASDAEALQALRRAFPASSLAARVAAVTDRRAW